MPWAGKDLAQFEKEYSMKPVTVKGVLDVENQFQVEKSREFEKGCEIVTPFYTHLDKNGKPCGILVSRGWMPDDLRNYRFDTEVDKTRITGVLYRGDAGTKYSKPNHPAMGYFRDVKPEEMAVLAKLPNEEAGQFMLKVVDLNEEAPTPLPEAEDKKTLTNFVIPAERHEAYANFWDTLTYFGVVANTAVWLYL